jgi:segregation and condensation protein A
MRLGGLALLTSSMIYKLKVDRLFYDEKRSFRKKPSDLQEPVEALSMPFRLRTPVSDIDDLVAALESLMKEISRSPSSPVEEGVFQPGLEARVVEQDTIAVMLKAYSDHLLAGLSRKEPTAFGDLIKGLQPIEVARVFIVLLFLAHSGRIILLQEEDAVDFSVLGVGEAIAR